MKTPRLVLVTLAAAGGLALTTPAFAAPESDSDQPAQGKEADQAFSGKVDALNNTERTLTVDGKLVYVSPTTRFTKGGKMVTFSDLKVGDKISGMSHRTFDGKTEATSITVDDQPAQE